MTLRRTVSMSLCEWKPEIAAALLPDLVARFDDSDPQVRWNVLGSLTGGERGTALDVAVAVPALVACLRHEDEETRGIALGALQDLGEAAAPAARAVAAFLDSDDETERWSALQTLGAIGPAARPFLGAITDRLSDEDEFVREHAAFTIGLLGRESGPHIAALEAALEDPMIRDAAARVLWELTGETTRTLPVLLDGARAGRIPALYGLFRMAPEVPEAVPAITPGLEHRSWRVRHATIRALCRCGSTAASAVEPLRSAMLDDRLGNRLAAVEALGRIGPAARPAIPDIRRLLGWGRSWRDDETIRVTEEALRAIER